MLWVRVPPEPFGENIRPRGAAWSARHSVTVEITGSNPVGDASMARYANWLSGEAQTFVSAGSNPACATFWVVVLAAACKAGVTKQARRMTRGSTPSRPILGPFVYWQDSGPSSRQGGFDSRTGHSWPSGVIGKHATLRTSCPCGVGVRISPWLLRRRRASAQLGLISSDRRVQHPDLQLLAGYANWQSDEVESLVTLWVRLPLRLLIPWSNGHDAWLTLRKQMVQFHPGSL